MAGFGRALLPLLAGLVIACDAATTSAVVVANRDPMTPPVQRWVGQFNGSSGVAISTRWFITAKHVGGGVGTSFRMHNVTYRAAEIVQHPTFDLQLVRVVEVLPGYCELADPSLITMGTPCVLGGMGVTAGESLPNGYSWSGPRTETWGANTLESEGFLLTVQFDNPATTDAVPHEALFAVNDSGGGLFIYGPTGELTLAGIAVSVTGWGSSEWGNAAYSINVASLHNWILPIVDPSRPLASSVQAPRASFGQGIAGIALLTGLASIARRRRRGA